MALSSLLYISRSTMSADDAKQGVDRIVATAVARNPALGLTGALLFTGSHFAQVLEGDATSIDLLMDAVRRDPRHDEILIVERVPLARRHFADWSMAYFGPSQFVSGHVTRLLNDRSPAEHRRGADWLRELLCAFAADRHGAYWASPAYTVKLR